MPTVRTPSPPPPIPHDTGPPPLSPGGLVADQPPAGGKVPTKGPPIGPNCAYYWRTPNVDVGSGLPLVGGLFPKAQFTICFDPVVGGLKLFVGVGAMLVLIVLLVLLLARGSGVARVAGVAASAATTITPTSRAARRARVRAPIESERRAQETHDQRARLREAAADRSMARAARTERGRARPVDDDPEFTAKAAEARQIAARRRAAQAARAADDPAPF